MNLICIANFEILQRRRSTRIGSESEIIVVGKPVAISKVNNKPNINRNKERHFNLFRTSYKLNALTITTEFLLNVFFSNIKVRRHIGTRHC